MLGLEMLRLVVDDQVGLGEPSHAPTGAGPVQDPRPAEHLDRLRPVGVPDVAHLRLRRSSHASNTAISRRNDSFAVGNSCAVWISSVSPNRISPASSRAAIVSFLPDWRGSKSHTVDAAHDPSDPLPQSRLAR